jgi:hypothetical protein
MNAVEAECELKNQIIDGRIQVRYEQLSGGFSIEGEKLARVRALPLDYLKKLADKLDLARTGSAVYSQRPIFIVESIISEYSVACWADKQANLDANGQPQSK